MRCGVFECCSSCNRPEEKNPGIPKEVCKLLNEDRVDSFVAAVLKMISVGKGERLFRFEPALRRMASKLTATNDVLELTRLAKECRHLFDIAPGRANANFALSENILLDRPRSHTGSEVVPGDSFGNDCQL